MEYDRDRVDEVELALMYLTLHGDRGDIRAWKGFDWGALGRLHEKGWIGDPVSKAKSVVLTEAGEAECARLFRKYFASEE